MISSVCLEPLISIAFLLSTHQALYQNFLGVAEDQHADGSKIYGNQ